jgi:hypothetical protein
MAEFLRQLGTVPYLLADSICCSLAPLMRKMVPVILERMWELMPRYCAARYAAKRYPGTTSAEGGLDPDMVCPSKKQIYKIFYKIILYGTGNQCVKGKNCRVCANKGTIFRKWGHHITCTQLGFAYIPPPPLCLCIPLLIQGIILSSNPKKRDVLVHHKLDYLMGFNFRVFLNTYYSLVQVTRTVPYLPPGVKDKK